jgi:hypothetical protein
MSRSLAQQKIDLAQKVLSLTKRKDIKAVAVLVEKMAPAPLTLSPEEEEDVRLGIEDFEAGRYSSWEDVQASILAELEATYQPKVLANG